MASGQILIVVPSLAYGGAEGVALNLAGEFVRRGCPVTLAILSGSAPLANRIDSQVHVEVLGQRTPWSACLALSDLLRRTRPAAVLSVLSHANVIAAVARRLARAKCTLVCSEHANLSLTVATYGGWKLRLTRLALHGALRDCDRVVGVSQGVCDDLIRSLGLPAGKVVTIYNPVVSAQMLNDCLQRLDHRWAGNSDVPLIVAAGRLTRQKDYPTLLNAIAMLRRRRAVRLIILGEGELREELTCEVEHLGIAKDVELPGHVTNPLPYMAAATVFVLASRFEGLGNVLIEAMACGAAVVATDCPSGPGEILENGRWGRLVPVGNSAALAAAIESTIDDISPPDVRRRAADFTVARAADEYLRLLLGHPYTTKCLQGNNTLTHLQ